MRRYIKTNELYHHGIKGQKWGVRRFQKAGGGLTPAGKKRYGKGGDVGKEKGPNDVKAKPHKRLQEADRQKQMKALSERNDINRRDKKLAAYGSRTKSARLAGEMSKAAVVAALQDAGMKRDNATTAERQKAAQQAASEAYKEFNRKEKQLNRLSEAYNPDGTGKKNNAPAIKRAAVGVAVFAATASYNAAKQKAEANRAKHAEQMKRWEETGVLPDKYQSIVDQFKIDMGYED